ncbi:hypothetical protein FGIG_00062 [Fasciola gigantica]|uniref:Uncharacterized protein n=1 Tax=Fasciola gigantica TaxID=46835 RepID=A0A504YJF7_FASGI|nr:hypothetical protein FGIG_00062 [Fasciola gigantica]
MLTGREPGLPTDVVVLITNTELLSAELAWQTNYLIQSARELARRHLSSAYRYKKGYYDGRVVGSPIQYGEQVHLNTPVSPTGVPAKLHLTWSGPFTVLEILSDFNSRIAQSNTIDVQAMISTLTI